MPANVEKRIAGFIRGIMRANMPFKRLNMRAHRHRAAIAILFQKREGRRLRMPRRQELHRKADCGGGEHAVRPDHLRAASSRAVFLGLHLQPLVGDEAAAAQARRAGRRNEPVSYLGPWLASCFLISGLSYNTTFNSELRISSFPLYSI